MYMYVTVWENEHLVCSCNRSYVFSLYQLEIIQQFSYTVITYQRTLD